MPDIVWKSLPYNPNYEVSNVGGVRSWVLPGPGGRRREVPKDIAIHTNHNGYQVVNIRVNGKRTQFRVHRLVLLAFEGPCPEGCNVDHINGLRHDNRLENLRYLDIPENSAQGAKEGEENPNTKLSWYMVRLIRETPHITQVEWAEKLGVSQHAIHCIRANKTWKEQ